MPTLRRKKLEKLLAAMEKVGPIHAIGGDPLDMLIADVRKSWEVMDVLERDMYAPGHEATENDLICVFEDYVKEGNKEDG